MLKKILAALAMFYAALSFAAVDVNTGSPADLDGVKGIGPALSGKIVEERKKGNFKDWNDFITRVKGVGDKNAAKLSAGGLTVNGAAYAGAPAKETKAKPAKPAPAAAAAPAAPAATGAAATAAAGGTATTVPAIATKPAMPAAPAAPAATTAPAKPAAPATKQ